MLAEYTNGTPAVQDSLRRRVMSGIVSDFRKNGMLEVPEVKAMLASLERTFQVRGGRWLAWAMWMPATSMAHMSPSSALPQEGLNPLLPFLSLLDMTVELRSLADLAETERFLILARADVDTITLFVKDLGMLQGAHFCNTYSW